MLFRYRPSHRYPTTGQHAGKLHGTICAVILISATSCRTTGLTTVTPQSPASSPGSPASSVAAGRPSAPAGLPPVPAIERATLVPLVQYPSENQLITSRDSNFVLGSVGSGDAKLSINGVDVSLASNGAFIAWLPNPPVSAPRYDLVVSRGNELVRRSVRIRYAMRTTIPAEGARLVDSGSVLPLRGFFAVASEWIRVSVRAAANARVQLELADGTRQAMATESSVRATSRRAAESGRDPIAPQSMPLGTAPSDSDVGTVFATDVPASALLTSAYIVAERGTDTVRLAVPIVQVSAPNTRWLGVLRSTSVVGSDTDRVINARTIPDGTYKWLLLPGTVLDITGKQNGWTRVKLDDALDVWLANDDIVALPEGSAMPRRVTGGVRVSPSREWVDVSIAMGERPAFLVEPDGRTLVLTLYGVQANPEISPILGNDTLVRRISWDQVGTNRVRFTFALSQPTYGWLSMWDESRRAFVLRIRRKPTIDSVRPLAGLTIAVDPGHPPAGATGPTGLYEGHAVLPVAERLYQLLLARGARPILTRETLAPVGLTERAVAARRMNAHAFVSIHLNALPDGVNPFTANGTSTLFYHQSSEPLARPVQSALVASFGLRDLGVHYQNLAVARPTWYPSVLTEGLFLMMPEQEAAMRNPGFLLRYATAIADGLEAYFRELRKP